MVIWSYRCKYPRHLAFDIWKFEIRFMLIMTESWDGNAHRISGPLWGKSIDDQRDVCHKEPEIRNFCVFFVVSLKKQPVIWIALLVMWRHSYVCTPSQVTSVSHPTRYWPWQRMGAPGWISLLIFRWNVRGKWNSGNSTPAELDPSMRPFGDQVEIRQHSWGKIGLMWMKLGPG